MLLLRPQVSGVFLPTRAAASVLRVRSLRFSSTTTSTSAKDTTDMMPAPSVLDSSPLEFLSNLTSRATSKTFGTPTPKLAKALSCTPDTTPTPQLETGHIPFEVKTKTANPNSAHVANEALKQQSPLAPYIQLSKPRLTALVVLSAICSYALTPLNATVPQLMFLTLGTGLCSASANAINQGREPEFDKLMQRTVSRPIVRGLLTPGDAYRFAALAGSAGVGILALGVNPTVAVLGGANIVLYGWIYTSLKRRSIVNTWVGAIVGAIPPLMGWAASSPLSHPCAWCLAALLYAWQFPHFNALSHNIRNEYKSAGYVMAAHKNPRLNARVGFRYALLMFPICLGLTYWGVTDSVFPLDSALLNGWMAYWAGMFWWQQHKNYKNGQTPSPQGIKLANIYAKRTFWASVWHLPGVLILAMLHKKGRWDWLLGVGTFES